MSERDLLERVEIGPEDATASVIWLHGLGADGHDFEPIVPELGLPRDLGVRFVFPHAEPRAVTLNAGMVMRAWYDILSLDLEHRSHDERGIRRSAEQVRQLVDRERERGVRPERIVLAGFSQGGAIAIHTALRCAHRLAGLIALSCYLVLPDTIQREASEPTRGLPVFMGHGQFDPVVPVRAGEVARDRLVALAHPVTWRTYPVPHAVHPQEISDVGAFLVERLALAPDEKGSPR